MVRIRVLALGLLASLSFVPSLYAEDPWVHRGPYGFGARTLAVAVDPSDPDRLFAGSASAGLWKREPGARWQHVDTAPHRVLGVGAIAFHPRHPEILYVGTGEVYRHRRADGGLDVHTTRGSYGIGILESRDGGKTWQASLAWKPADRTGVQDLAIVPEGESAYTVWAATTEGVYRLRSAVGARPGAGDWQKSLDVVMATSLSPNPARPGELLAACGSFGSAGHGLYLTEDGGESWQKLLAGVPATFAGKAVLGRSPSQPSTVYASIGNQTAFAYGNAQYDSDNGAFACQYQGTDVDPINWLLRSDDGGRTWTTQNTHSYAGSQGWYSHAVAVSPSDPSRLWIAGIGLQRSYDGGRSFGGSGAGLWDVVNDAKGLYFMADSHRVVALPQGAGRPERLYFASDQGVYRSLDGGRSIQAFNEGYDTVQLYRAASSAAASGFVAATGQDQGPGFYLYQSSPGAAGGWSWVAGYGHEAGSMTYAAGDKLLYVGQHFNARVSRYRLGLPTDEQYDAPDGDNGGAHFIPDVDPFHSSDNCLDTTAWYGPLVVAPAGDTLYAARNVLYRSTASALSDEDPSHSPIEKAAARTPGLAWEPTGFGKDRNPIVALTVSPSGSGSLIAATAPRYEPMHVYASGDGGFTWHDVTGPSLPTDREPRTIVLDAARGRIYLVIGGFGAGHVWTAPLNDRLWSGNGGQPLAWQRLDGDAAAGALPDVPHADLAVDPANGDLYVANQWGVYRSGDAGSSWQAWSGGLYPAVDSMQLLLYGEERLLRLITHGNGLWERALPPSR